MITEEQLVGLLRYDFSRGTERFRDELLKRCLVILNEENGSGRESSLGADATDEPSDTK